MSGTVVSDFDLESNNVTLERIWVSAGKRFDSYQIGDALDGD